MMIGLGKTTLVLVALVLGLGGCGGATVSTSGEPAVVSSAGDGAAVPVLDLFEDPVPDHPDPARRAGAASNLIECEHGIWDGGWSEDFGPPGSGPDPEAALAAFLVDGLFAVPRAGFAFAGTDDSRRLFTYSNDGAFLRLDDTSYVRDPDGLLIDDAGIGPFEADVALPADAADTGYRRDGRELWIAADRSTAYIVTSDRVEAWPSPVHVFGCA